MALSAEQFGKALVGSGLLSADELKAIWAAVPAGERPKDGESFSALLIKQERLNEFQSRELLSASGTPLVLGDYVLLAKIGAGGMGQVFKAHHRRMDRLAAIKLLPSSLTKDEATVKRFEREVKAAAKLSHPNIVQTYDASVQRGVWYLVMEYVDGKDLSAIVKENGPLPVAEAVDCIAQAARGLAFAHGKGVVHRDIKPANLLLDKDGTIKILDMGLARIDAAVDAADHQLTNTGQVMGTVDYMAPEQAQDTHAADHRSDIYSLGCSLFRLLTGQNVYEGDTVVKKLFAHAGEPIPTLAARRPDVPAEVDRIFQKMVAKKPADRYQQASQLAAELEMWKTGGDKSGTDGLGVGVAGDAQLSSFLKTLGGPKGAAATSTPSVKTSAKAEQTMTFVVPEIDTDPKSEVLVSRDAESRATGRDAQRSVSARKPQATRDAKRNAKPRTKFIAAGIGAAVVVIALAVWILTKKDEATPPIAGKSGSHATADASPAPTEPAEVAVSIPEVVASTTPTSFSPTRSSPGVPNGQSAGRWFDIKALVDPALDSKIDVKYPDAVRIEAGDVVLGANSMLRLPVTLDGNYQLRAEFTAWNVNGHLQVECPIGDVRPVLVVAEVDKGDGTHWAGVQTIDSFGVRDPQNPTQNHQDRLLVENQRHALDLNVAESQGRITIQARLDGKPLVNWSGNASQLKSQPRDKAPPRIAINCLRGTLKLHSVELQRLDGNIEPVRPEDAAKLVAVTRPSPAKSLPVAESPASVAELLTSPDYEWTEPVNLGPNVNGDKADQAPTVSADGLCLIFNSYRSGGGDLFECRRNSVNDPWGPAIALDTVNTPNYENQPGLSDDGLTLLFGGSGGHGKAKSIGDGDIWQTRRATRDAPWETPVNLGDTINTAGAEKFARLSADGLTLFYVPAVTGEQEDERGGKGDVWISRRKSPDAAWEKPANLGPPVNTNDNEDFEQPLADGKSLLFQRGFAKNDGRRLWLAEQAADGKYNARQLDFPFGNLHSFWLSADGQTMLFSAALDGGLGDTDLWMTRRVPKAEVAAVAPTTASTAPLDLIALTDPAQDRGFFANLTGENNWTRADGKLTYTTDGKAGAIVAPVSLADCKEYEVEADVRRLSGNSVFTFNLPLAKDRKSGIDIVIGGQIQFKLEGGKRTELGRWPAAAGIGGRVTIRVRLGTDGLFEMRVNGQVVAQWKGDTATIGHPADEVGLTKDQMPTSIFCFKDSYEFTSWKVTGIDGTPRVLREPPQPPAAAQPTIDLLPLVDVRRDAPAGRWSVVPDGLHVAEGWLSQSGDGKAPRLQLPYLPGDEYDVEAEFTPIKNEYEVALLLASGGENFVLQLDHHPPSGVNNWYVGPGFVDGKTLDLSSAGLTQDQPWLINGRRYRLHVEVRRDALRATLDGASIVDWKGDFARLKITNPNVQIPEPNRLGLIAFRREAVFHKVSVREVTGRGTFIDGVKPALTNPHWNAPNFQQWVADTQKLPAARQLEEVSKKLVELNPGFDGKLYGGDGVMKEEPEPRIENQVVTQVRMKTADVTDLSPLQVFSGLQGLMLIGLEGRPKAKCADLAPLRDMKSLRAVNIYGMSVTDISPLQDLPLDSLVLMGNLVSDLRPIAKLTSLKRFWCSFQPVTNLSPAKGLRLEHLVIESTSVADLEPLRDMTTLTRLFANNTLVLDLSPLATCTNLQDVRIRETKATPADVAALQAALPNCKIEWDDPARPAIPATTPTAAK